MANLKNRTNEYQEALGMALFDEVPKSVLAAIAVSALTCGGDQLEQAKARLAHEWRILHANGVVSQSPGKVARSIIAANPEPDL